MLTRLRTSPIVLGALLSTRAVLAQPAEAPAPAEKPATPAQPPAAPAPEQKAEEPEGAQPAEEPPDAEAEPPAAPAEPPAAPEPAPVPTGPLFTDPGADAAAIESLRQQQRTPAAPEGGAAETDIYARDWWTYARPVVELHGYFRVRAELFHQFSLGRIDVPGAGPWARPPDDFYVDVTGTPRGPELCTPEEADTGSSDDPSNLVGCKNATQAGANMRLRLDPEIRISDNLRISAQVDLLDNVVLGSTPGGYANGPGGAGYSVIARDGTDAVAFFDQTMSPPRSGVNSLSDSVHVKRAWAEYATPIGELRFGRMPHHWGLGMLYNAGDGIDDDYQSTIDRLQFVTSIKPLDLYISAAWDFPSEGAVTFRDEHGQAYDTAQLDDVDQWVFSVARLQSPELTRLALSRGELVVNAGAQLTYRTQLLTSDFSGLCGDDDGRGAPALDCGPGDLGFTRRDATYWIPDIWVQVLYGGFRFELEAATVQGVLGNTGIALEERGPRFDISEWGFAAEVEQRLVEDRLRLGLDFGWASGDPDVDGLTPQPGPSFGQLGNNTIETFRFNPSYRLDLILYRNILERVQGTYYFRPNVAYDFMRESTGQRLGGSVAAIWSRASQFIQAPGHARDLGVELNAALYFQSSDGALNDAPERTGGFFAQLEYGVLFPMDGLGYPDGTAAEIRDTLGRANAADLSNAQILRLFLGAAF